MRIGEDLCLCFGECYHRNSDCFGRISRLIEAFSQFDTVELSNISHGSGSYITTLSVLNSSRLRVSFQMVSLQLHSDYFMSQCIIWLTYKAPNLSQPPRELYLDEKLGFPGVRALLRGLISVGFYQIIMHGSSSFFGKMFSVPKEIDNVK